MPTVTALRADRRERVRVDLDGQPWRILPAAAVAVAGLRVGIALDRVRARELARALRRVRALDAAGRALSRRDRSTAGLSGDLERRGIPGPAADGAVETLTRLGYLDDAGFAKRRAAALAERGVGDAGIRLELERERLAAEHVEAAIASLPPETARAEGIAAARGLTPATLRRLAAKGFGEDALEDLAERLRSDLEAP